MEEYLRNVIKQFKLSTGTKNIDINSQEFIDEFSAWIKSRRKMGKEYACFLDYLNFRFAEPGCAEVGKGEYDSIVKPFETTLITPVSSIKKVSDDRIITGHMRVYESTPLLIRHFKGGNQMSQIPTDIIHTYMTHNILSESLISGWEDLHNSGSCCIIVGIFGSIYDKDIEERIKIVENLREKLTCYEFDEDYSTTDDMYMYALGSMEKKILTKKKYL